MGSHVDTISANSGGRRSRGERNWSGSLAGQRRCRMSGDEILGYDVPGVARMPASVAAGRQGPVMSRVAGRGRGPKCECSPTTLIVPALITARKNVTSSVLGVNIRDPQRRAGAQVADRPAQPARPARPVRPQAMTARHPWCDREVVRHRSGHAADAPGEVPSLVHQPPSGAG
jgi:hypothetical protein